MGKQCELAGQGIENLICVKGGKEGSGHNGAGRKGIDPQTIHPDQNMPSWVEKLVTKIYSFLHKMLNQGGKIQLIGFYNAMNEGGRLTKSPNKHDHLFGTRRIGVGG